MVVGKSVRVKRDFGSQPWSLAVVPLDSLTFSSARQISQADRAAISQLLRMGLKLVFVTSRVFQDGRGLLKEMGQAHAPLVSFGGALASSPDLAQIWHCVPLASEDTPMILRAVTLPDVCVLYHTREGATIAGRRHPLVEEWQNRSRCPVIFSSECEEFQLRKLVGPVGGPVQIDVLGSPQRIQEGWLSIQRVAAHRVAVSRPFQGQLTIRSRGVDKLVAVQKLMLSLGSLWEQTIAFGREDSDAMILKSARLGIALSGASARARIAARLVCESGSTDPFADALLEALVRRMSLIE